jgi:hypothetical protein
MKTRLKFKLLMIALLIAPAGINAQEKGTLMLSFSFSFAKGGLGFSYFVSDGVGIETFVGGIPHLCFHLGAGVILNPNPPNGDLYFNVALTKVFFAGSSHRDIDEISESDTVQVNTKLTGLAFGVGGTFAHYDDVHSKDTDDPVYVRTSYFAAAGPVLVLKSSSEFKTEHTSFEAHDNPFGRLIMFLELGARTYRR